MPAAIGMCVDSDVIMGGNDICWGACNEARTPSRRCGLTLFANRRQRATWRSPCPSWTAPHTDPPHQIARIHQTNDDSLGSGVTGRTYAAVRNASLYACEPSALVK